MAAIWLWTSARRMQWKYKSCKITATCLNPKGQQVAVQSLNFVAIKALS